MQVYPTKFQIFIRFLYHFALFPYFAFGLLAPVAVYFIIREDVQVWGNMLKLLDQAGVTSTLEIILFAVFAVLCFVLPFVAMFLAVKRYQKSRVYAFVLSVYVLIPVLGVLFFSFIARLL